MRPPRHGRGGLFSFGSTEATAAWRWSQNGGGPHAYAPGASVVPKRRKPPRPCGEGPGGPKAKEAPSPRADWSHLPGLHGTSQWHCAACASVLVHLVAWEVGTSCTGRGTCPGKPCLCLRHQCLHGLACWCTLQRRSSRSARPHAVGSPLQPCSPLPATYLVSLVRSLATFA